MGSGVQYIQMFTGSSSSHLPGLRNQQFRCGLFWIGLRPRENFHEDEGFDYFDREDETTLECINLVLGSTFVDLKKGADQFRLILSDHIFKDTNSIRSLTRRMGSLPIPSSPFSFLDPQEDTQPQHKIHVKVFWVSVTT